MDLAVVRIIHNIKNRNPILVFGDYEEDGTTGAAMLSLELYSIETGRISESIFKLCESSN